MFMGLFGSLPKSNSRAATVLGYSENKVLKRQIIKLQYCCFNFFLKLFTKTLN